jgi:hypothetical protein
MRVSLLVFSLIALCTPTHSQDSPGTSEQVIRHIIESGSYDGQDDKQLSRIGDAAAIQTIRIIGGKNISDPEAENVLAVLELAFSDPKLVANPSDQIPRACLFVLRYLELGATNADLKQRIDKTRGRILKLSAYTDRVSSLSSTSPGPHAD